MTQPITSLDDLFAADRLTGLAANRHGTVLATVQSLDPDGASWRTAVHLLAAPGVPAEDLPQALTQPSARARLHEVGEDGTAWLSLEREDEAAEDDSQQTLWALPPRGEARPVLRRAGGIEKLRVRGPRLVFSAPVLPSAGDEGAHDELSARRRKQKVSGVLHESFPVRSWDHDLGPGEPALFTADAPEFAARRIRLPEGRLEGFEPDPQGGTAAVAVSTVRRGIHVRTGVWLVDLEHEAAARPLALPEDPDAEVEAESTSFAPGPFSPDGSRLVLLRYRESLPGQSLKVAAEVLELETGERTPVAPQLDRWPENLLWLDEQTLVFTGDDRGRGAVWATRVGESSARKLTEEEAHFGALAVIGPGRLAALRDAVDHSAEAVALRVPEDGPAEVTALPAAAPVTRGVGRLEEVSTRADDGESIRAWLALPQGQGPHPLLVFVHGGPWGSWNSWTWRWNPWPFVAAGYAVLLPDPALSTGYGQHMIDRGTDALGGQPYRDVLALTDAAEGREDIDAGRTAALGGSYGGYMANWLAGHTGTRFRCIVTHASLWDTDVMARTTDNGVWQEWLFDRDGAQGPENDPSRFADRIQAPMLVIHGDRDYRVPVSQAHLLWADLRRHTDPGLGHRFLYFPDENHWVLQPGNSRLWYQTVLAFADRHVRGAEWVRPELLG